MTKTGWFFTLPLFFILSGLVASLAYGYQWLQILTYSLYATGGSLTLWLLLTVSWSWWQKKHNGEMATSGICLVISPTVTMTENPDPRLWQFLEVYLIRRWSWPSPHFCFEVATNGAGAVSFHLYLPAGIDQRGIVEQLMREYPGVEIRQVDTHKQIATAADSLPDPLGTPVERGG